MERLSECEKRMLDKVYETYGIDPKKLPHQDLAEGILVEYEHGKTNAQMNAKTDRAKHADKKTNLTDLDRTHITEKAFNKTAKIALAHFAEGKNYYKYLKEMEHKLDQERGDEPFYDVFLNTKCISDIAKALR